MRLILAAIAAWGTASAYDVNCQTRGRSNFLGSNSGCWLQWSGWSECLGTCGKGIKTATRKCRGPEGFAIPGITPGCTGSDVRRRACSDSSIVASRGDSCAYWSFWSEWSSCQRNVGEYCDKSTFFGREIRNRVCNDPEATLLGIAPRCAPDALTAVTNQEERSCSLTIPDTCSPNVFEQFIAGEWSDCNVPCGAGTQEMTLSHQCANYPDTWVPPTCWFKKQYRACKNAASPCCPDEWSEWSGKENPCNEYTQTRYRAKGSQCRPESETRQMPRSVAQTPCQFENDESGWGACMPQPSDWNPNILTTCGGNGIQIRTCEHMCAKNGGCQYGDYNCEWLQPPFSFKQERRCGQERKSRIEIQCDPTGCGLPKCQQIFYCDNDWRSQQTVEIDCPLDLVTDQCQASKPSCALPSQQYLDPSIPPCPAINTCGCGITHKIYRSTQCGEVTEERVACPGLREDCVWSEFQRSEALQRAIMSRKCVCENSLDHLESRKLMCQTIAENGEICSRVEKQGETRVSDYASAQCLSLPQRTPCPEKQCLQPYEDQRGPVFQVFRYDYCSSDQLQIPEGEPQQCYTNLPQCCTWSQWSVDACPSTNGLCPSQAPMRTRRRTNTCPDQFPVEIETTNIECPVACPAWEPFGEWSECNNILEDGTHCGGYRTRVRGYPCRQDVMNGRCRPSTWGFRSNGDNVDFFTEFDTSNTGHHSTHCYNMMLSDNSRFFTGSWSSWQLDENRPCDWDRNLRYVRSRTVSDKCNPDGESRVEFETKIEASQPCVDQPPTGPDACQYSADKCSANILYNCVATDICGESVTKSRPATPLECPIQQKLSSPVTSACRAPENMFIDTCTGVATETITDLCTGEKIYRDVPCELPARWSDFSEFEDVPVSDSWKRVSNQYPTNYYYRSTYNTWNSYDADMSRCNVCGGSLVSTRKLMCDRSSGVLRNLGQEDVEYRSVECPPAPWSWSAWSECPPCAASKSDTVCQRTRNLVTRPSAMGCPRPEGPQFDSITLPPCKRVRYDYTAVCQHNTDPSANCGQGIMKTRQIITTIDNLSGQVEQSFTKDYPFYFLDARNGTTTDLIASADDSRKVINRVCNLGCRIYPVVGEWSQCNQCGGGNQMRVTEFVCKDPYNSQTECRFPHGEIPKPAEAETRSCPAPVRAAETTEWSGQTCSMCQTTRKERRTCIGGLYENATNVFNFYRSSVTNCQCGECCVKDPNSTLISATIEERNAPCPPVARPPRCVTVTDPECQCGECPTTVICTDPCTNAEISREAGPTTYKPYRVMEGAWSACLYSTNLCKQPGVTEYFGFQNRTISNECINGRIQLPRVETRPHESCRIEVMPQAPIYGNCMRPYGASVCSPPMRTVTYQTYCNRQLINSTVENVACEWEDPEVWTDWTECSVECGVGVRTRNKIRQCSPDIILETETENCGCPASVWTDWSEWQNPEDVCVPCKENQVVTSVRTCQHPKQENYLRSNTYYNYGFGYTRSAFSSPCFSKCNLCTADAEGNMEYKTQQFNPEDFDKCKGTTYTTIQPEVCPECPTPGYAQVQTTTYCGRVVNTPIKLECPVPNDITHPPQVTYGECSVPCGMGTRTVITRRKCQEDVITTEPCQGQYGDIIQLPTGEFSECSADCDGGVKTRKTLTVCELNNDIILKVRQDEEPCNLEPCAYWAGWTEFGLCSATCGDGVRTRYRQCHGGRPQPFMRSGESSCAGSSVDTIPCNEGACCDYPWSGWSNCCMEGGERRRLKWRGFNAFNSAECNRNSKYEEDIEPCGTYQQEKPDSMLAQCSSLRARPSESKSWEYEYNYSTIYDGVYMTNNGYRYEVINGRWFRLSAFGQKMEVSVSSAISQLDRAYIYKIGGIWYKFNNGRLYETTYTQESPRIVTDYTYNYVKTGLYSVNGVAYELFINNDDKPIWSIINGDGTSSIYNMNDKFYQNEWYYQFNDVWYKFDRASNSFVSVMNLPWEVMTTTYYTPDPSSYTIVDAAGSGLTTGVTYTGSNDMTTTYVSNTENNVVRSSQYLPNNTSENRYVFSLFN